MKAEDVRKSIDIKWEHCRVWRIIGTELGVDADVLSAIEKVHTTDNDRLHAVIDGVNPAPTREAVSKILESANITNAIAGCYIIV